jgi:hypothetical protein
MSDTLMKLKNNQVSSQASDLKLKRLVKQKDQNAKLKDEREKRLATKIKLYSGYFE